MASKESKNTTFETLPDGTVRVKTTRTVHKTTSDGRTISEQVTTIQDSSSSNRTGFPEGFAVERGSTDRSSRFKLPSFFHSIGKNPSPSPSPVTEKPISLDDFRRDLLRTHNLKRARHNAPTLALSGKLNTVAQEWAEHLAKIERMEHRQRSEYGENIFMGYNSDAVITPDQAAESWYSEEKQYNYRRPSMASGHFTQMVWKGSKEVGFGRATSRNGSVYVVANYSPPGNVIGKYEENVERPR